MERQQSRLPKIAALAAPAFIWLAANACESGKTEPSNTPVLPTTEGQVGAVITNPTIAPAIETISAPQNTATNEYTVSSAGHEFTLYSNKTIDDLTTPQATDKIMVWMDTANFRDYLAALDNIKFMGSRNPPSPRIIGQFEIAADQINNNCDGSSQELEQKRNAIKDLASVGKSLVDDIFEQTDAFLTGPCSLVAENQVAKKIPNSSENPQSPKSLEPYNNRFGSLVFTSFKGNYAYTYSLLSQVNLEIAIPTLKTFVGDPAYARTTYIKNPQTRSEVTDNLDKVLQKERANPNDPEIPKLLLEAGNDTFSQCPNSFNSFIFSGLASSIYSKNPAFWQEHQFEFLDTSCVNTVRKYVISPEFPIKPLPNGTFVYEGVTYPDILSYSQKLRAIYPRDSGRIIDWLQHAADNQGTGEEANGLNSASFIIQGGCKDNDVAFNLLRLMASMSQDPQNDIRLRGCYQNFFKDQYYFER